MTHSLIEQLAPFVGRQLIGCIDEISLLADAQHFSVNVIDPDYNTASIDNEASRLNVRTDRYSIITSFTIG